MLMALSFANKAGKHSRVGEANRNGWHVVSNPTPFSAKTFKASRRLDSHFFCQENFQSRGEETALEKDSINPQNNIQCIEVLIYSTPPILGAQCSERYVLHFLSCLSKFKEPIHWKQGEIFLRNFLWRNLSMFPRAAITWNFSFLGNISTISNLSAEWKKSNFQKYFMMFFLCDSSSELWVNFQYFLLRCHFIFAINWINLIKSIVDKFDQINCGRIWSNKLLINLIK